MVLIEANHNYFVLAWANSNNRANPRGRRHSTSFLFLSLNSIAQRYDRFYRAQSGLAIIVFF